MGYLWAEGKAPPSTTQYGKTVESIPAWLSDYSQGVLAKANAVASLPYQRDVDEQGNLVPRIADFTGNQLAAQDVTKANIGSWMPYLDQTQQALSRAGEGSPLQAATPFLAQAAQRTPEVIDQYMNPYIENVINRNQQLAQRNLTENVLPSVNASFAGKGQFGSRRMMDAAYRGTRDIQEGLNAQNQAALAQAYQQAGQQFTSDAGREATLAATAGDLQRAGSALDLETADRLTQLGMDTSQMGLTDAAALEAIGASEQALNQRALDLRAQEFERETQYPRETLDWMNALIKGIPYSTYQERAQDVTPTNFQPSPLSQLISGATAAYGLTQLGKAKGGLVRYREAMA